MLTILKKNEAMLVSSMVSYVQRKQKGMHFANLAFITDRGDLKLEEHGFMPPKLDLFVPQPLGRLLMLSLLEVPQRFEHLLQRIRSNFPGIGFYEVVIENNGNVLRIYHLTEKAPSTALTVPNED